MNSQGINICQIIACTALAYELGVGEDPDYDKLIFKRKGQEFILNSRPASEGSYYDAINTWSIYATKCINRNAKSGLCDTLLDYVVERAYRYLLLWGGHQDLPDKNTLRNFISRELTDAFKKLSSSGTSNKINIIENIVNHISIRVKDYKGIGPTTALKLLHMIYPEKVPPFDSYVYKVIKAVCKNCNKMWDTYQKYLVLVDELKKRCEKNPEIQVLTKLKPFTKIVDQALWLLEKIKKLQEISRAAGAEKKALEVLANYGICPTSDVEKLLNTIRKILKTL